MYSQEQKVVRRAMMVDQARVRYMMYSGSTVRSAAQVATITRSLHRTLPNGGRGWRGAGKTPFFRKCSYASSL